MSLIGLAQHIDRRGRHRRTALRARIGTVIETLAGPAGPVVAGHTVDAGESTPQLLARLDQTLAYPTGESIWLSLAVIGGVLPTHAAVLATLRRARLDGAVTALSGVLRAPRPGWPAERGPWREVKVVTDRVLVDMHHTSQTDFATGIQRVARQAAQRWARDHDITLIGWTRFHTSLRELSPNQAHRALHGHQSVPRTAQIRQESPLILPPTAGPGGSANGPTVGGRINGSGGDANLAADSWRTLIVPWRCAYVLPELLAEPIRAQALQAMLEFSGGTGSMIGFDCVPLTSAETTAEGMSGGFSLMLAAMANGQRIAAISGGAANEYLGWRDMLAGAGLSGPQIAAISLPVEADEPTPDALRRARDLIVSGALPLVLVVGSHEPRKNHLAILQAAQLLWREGVAFSLVFVGGNGWHSEQFVATVNDLAALGRPVQLITALPDDLLWAAYRLARCVVFPSLNEGFGLPVAEALATGTPVITSAFGSMQEIAAEGGTLLVNPRDDADLTQAMRILICDDDVHTRLSKEAAMRSTRTWEQYAAQTWDYLVEGLAATPSLGTAAAADAGQKPSIGAV